jgi:ArsR family transcriptional regulator, arsenate/arsenite/antimonite-responsive transcriptional repressor
MEINSIVLALAALAQPTRLQVFRALVVAGEQGATPGALSEQLGVAPNTLSFHLKELVHADLVATERMGRNLIYRAQFDRMNAVLAYLTQNCCQGTPCELRPAAPCAAA